MTAITSSTMTPLRRSMSSTAGIAIAAAVVMAATCINWALSPWLMPTNFAMVYLLGIVFVAARFERVPNLVCALLSVLAFDFLFVPPTTTLRFADTQYLLTAVALLAVSQIVGTLALRARQASQAALAAQEERLRSSLLASLSHDLRTPLAVIAGSASSLRDHGERLSPQERASMLDALYGEAQHMSGMVTDLLEMTQLHSGGVTLKREWIPTEELLGAAIGRCRNRLAQHHVTTRIDPTLPLLHVDGVLVEKLLVNLLENAGKYTPSGTSVTISVAPVQGHIEICVEDEGPGFTPEVESHLFEKFFRAKPESSISGTGLGLSICRAIAQLHGGAIVAQNRHGGGAAFRVHLPAEPLPEYPPS